MRVNKRNGISLIVLVITIIIMIILAGTIILALSGNGVIVKANKAKFQSDISIMKEELEVYITNKIGKNKGEYEKEELYASSDTLKENGNVVSAKTIKDVLKSMDKKYLNEVEIINGKIVYLGEDLQKITWANEILLGIKGKELKVVTSETESIKLEESANLNLVNYRIYGNSEEDDLGKTQSVGDLDEEGNYKVPITIRGKNLFNKDGIERLVSNYATRSVDGYKVTTQGNEGNSVNAATAGELKIFNNIQLSSDKGYRFSIYMTLLEIGKWDTDQCTGIFLHGTGAHRYFYKKPSTIVGQRIKYTYPFTPEADLEDIIIRLNNCKWLIELDTIQIEEGSAATEYESYVEPTTYNIYLKEPLRKIDNYVDYIDFKTQEVVRNVKEVDGVLQGLDTPKREKISIPSILLTSITNIIEVNTTVSPSKIETLYYTK